MVVIEVKAFNRYLLPLVLTASSVFSASTFAIGNNTSDRISAGWQALTGNIKQTWNTPDSYDLYLPAITWHNRWAYDKEKTDRYNERPWGAGGGLSYYNEAGNWNGIYLMAFKDSFNKWEPIGGYGWEKIWRPLDDPKFQLGAGYTLGVTARDNWNYIPIPVVLPLASVGYGPATFQMTYIPGTYNNGNVFFAWFRWAF